MKIAILTSGILPVPAVQGGAVENLIDFYLAYNNQHKLHDITIYSVNHPDTQHHPALQSDVNHYHYIDTSSIFAKIRRVLYSKFHKDEYYNYFIEFYFEQAFKHLKKQSYDYIILENRPGYAYKLSQRISSKLILHLHNDLLNQNSKLHNEIFNNLHKVLTVSDYIKSRVCSIKETDKVRTLHNGIDLKRFSPQTESHIKREDIGLSENDFVLVFSGRINKDKGIAELIEAILLLDKKQIKLLVLGSTFFGNSTNDDAFSMKLKAKAQPLKERIIFTGFIPYSNMPDYLRLADIAVIPSVWDDPFPTTVLEAQAMKLPIITTRRGGIPEEVTEDNACIIDTDDHFVDDLASAILDLYDHPEKRKQMSLASFERSKLFDKEIYAKNFFAALENIL